MRLLLDTQLFAWIGSGWRDLTKVEREAIDRAEGDLYVSVITLWELRLKWRSDPRQATAERLITATQGIALAAARGITVAAITADVTATRLDPLPMHKDPFDDLLLVHARVLGAKLLTRDPLLLEHPLACHP